ISKPEISAIAQKYEQASGKGPGAFKELVREFAESVHHTTGRDLSPQEAVREFMARYGVFAQQFAPAQAPGAQATASGTPQVQPPTQPVQQVPPPPPVAQPPAVKVIPNVQGNNSTPIKPKIRRVKDIERAYNGVSRRNR